MIIPPDSLSEPTARPLGGEGQALAWRGGFFRSILNKSHRADSIIKSLAISGA